MSGRPYAGPCLSLCCWQEASGLGRGSKQLIAGRGQSTKRSHEQSQYRVVDGPEKEGEDPFRACLLVDNPYVPTVSSLWLGPLSVI